MCLNLVRRKVPLLDFTFKRKKACLNKREAYLYQPLVERLRNGFGGKGNGGQLLSGA